MSADRRKGETAQAAGDAAQARGDAAQAGGESAALQEARRVLEVEGHAILALVRRLGPDFDAAIDLLAACKGRVVTTGMGKSGIIARKLASTFSSTGTPALFLHPAEALHGDLGSVTEHDLLIALSHSGETGEIGRLLETIKRLDVPCIALTGRPESTLGRYADVVLNVGVEAEACPLGLAPTASTTASLAMGDALAMSLLRRKGFRAEDFALVHPGGRLGSQLRRVRDLMRTGDELPRVAPDASLADVMQAMTDGHLGAAVVVDGGGRLQGMLTDGDLRRLLQGRLPAGRKAELPLLKAAEWMTGTPRTISPDALASEALLLLETHKITSLVVVNDAGKVEGMVHLHDLWRMEMI